MVSFPFTGKQECSYDVDLQPPRAVVGQGRETKVPGSPMRWDGECACVDRGMTHIALQ